MTRRERAMFVILMTIAAASTLLFVAWWVAMGHVPSNFHGSAHVFDYVLFAALTLVLLHRPFMDSLTWYLSWHIRRPAEERPPQPGLRVAFITTFVPASEPIDLLYRCLPAMLAADYPHDVWVLDEGGSAEVVQLCEQLGVRYFTRYGQARYNQAEGPFAARTKGGNHNAWYDTHSASYDVVAQIDTDFVPQRNFLTKTLGYFRDPSIGWVGTPQVYGNDDTSFIARGAAQQQFTFYGPIMRGLGGTGSANLVGANHVVRVAALRDIDFYAGHLAEDLLTGMQLHAHGWRSVYVSEPLAVGEGPTTWPDYFAQQMRWAFGCIDILFHHSPTLFRRMGRRQAATYAALQQHYFNGVAMFLGIALLGVYFFGGVTAANVTLVQVLAWCGPAVLFRQLVVLWLQRFHPSPETDRGALIAGRVVSTVVWPVYLMAAFGVLRGKRLAFKVTPKGRAAGATYIPPAVARIHLILGLFSVSCIVIGLSIHHRSLPLLFWASLNSLTLMGFALFVYFSNARSSVQARLQHLAPRRSTAVQFPPTVVHVGAGARTPAVSTVELTTVDLSAVGGEPVSS